MCSISASYSLPWAMAFSKIEGLEVMPFNPSSSIRRLNSAPARNSRLRKSSQMDWPSCSSCLRRFMPRSSSESEGIDTMRLGDTRLAPRRMAASLLGTLLERDGKGSGSAPILRHRPVGGGNVSICLYQSRQFLPPPTRVGWGERRTPSAPHPGPCARCPQPPRGGGGTVSFSLYQSRQFLPPPTRVGWGERRTPSAPHPEPCSLCSQRSGWGAD